MFTWLAILCCHLVCGCGETKSLCKSYEGKKSSKKGKRLGHQMMHGKAMWKPRIGKIARLPGALPLNLTRRAYSTQYEPPVARGQRADARWVMVYSHKTQSFMKSGGQQKCLDKTLTVEHNIKEWWQKNHAAY